MPLPPDATLEDVKVRIRETNKSPNIGRVTTVTLKDGPQTYKLATLFEVLSPSKELHHYYLRLDDIAYKKKEGWTFRSERSTKLEDDKAEVRNLYSFLTAVYGDQLAGKKGDMRLVKAEDYARLQDLLTLIPNVTSDERMNVLKGVLSHINEGDTTVGDLAAVFEASTPTTLQHIAAASRMVEYKAAYEEMRKLVEDPSTTEPKFQAHLEKNPWMFGSEYSELLPRRNWTRDDQLDYMLRCTVDGYLEIVEIKTAFSDALFRKDDSRGSFYPSAKLSPVIGQVIRYIDEVDRHRNDIIVNDKVDPSKIRARVIVGRNGSDEHQAALRNFNAHLNRIEVITFDQLLRIAERVLQMFQCDRPAAAPTDAFDDIPF